MASCVVAPSSTFNVPVMLKSSTGSCAGSTTVKRTLSVKEEYAALSGFRRTVTLPGEVKVTKPSEDTLACFPDSVSKIVPPIVHFTPCFKRTGVQTPYNCTCAPTATVVGTLFLLVICTPVGATLAITLLVTTTSAVSVAKTEPSAAHSVAVIFTFILSNALCRLSANASPAIPRTISTIISLFISARSTPIDSHCA